MRAHSIESFLLTSGIELLFHSTLVLGLSPPRKPRLLHEMQTALHFFDVCIEPSITPLETLSPRTSVAISLSALEHPECTIQLHLLFWSVGAAANTPQ
jgi:hypothetical protein